MIHPYPTQAEAIKKIADAYNRTRLTPSRKRLLTRLLAWRRWRARRPCGTRARGLGRARELRYCDVRASSQRATLHIKELILCSCIPK